MRIDVSGLGWLTHRPLTRRHGMIMKYMCMATGTVCVRVYVFECVHMSVRAYIRTNACMHMRVCTYYYM